ncbi:MAG: hypothetical protein WC627_10210 [Legionella sp.]|jgi:hypothetical protein
MAGEDNKRRSTLFNFKMPSFVKSRSSPDLKPSQEVSSLQESIGSYSGDLFHVQHQEKFVHDRLQAGGEAELYKGLNEYQLKHQEEVASYKLVNQGKVFVTADDSKFFRLQFVAYVEQINEQRENQAYKKYEEECRRNGINPSEEAFNKYREEYPVAASVSLEEFLDPEGKELYRLALEEEANSKEFMDALFTKSTKKVGGEAWAQRPVVIVAGPSSSGKSTAVTMVLKLANKFIPKIKGQKAENYAVIIDGGIAREVSQMRKLVIEAATNQGFTGIKDIQTFKAPLDAAKDRVAAAAFSSTKLGIIIPETFADPTQANPFYISLLNRIDTLKNTVPIFCRVEGENPRTFAKVVSYLGNVRCWKTKDFGAKEPLDLNAVKVKENKPYSDVGYNRGSSYAIEVETQFQKRYPGKPCIVVINDMIFIDLKTNKEVEDKGAHTLSVSRRVFDEWMALPIPKISLVVYDKNDLMYLKEDKGIWSEAKKGDPGVIAVHVQTLQQWRNLKSDQQISLREYVENKSLWVQETKPGVWEVAKEEAPHAIEVSRQTWVKWNDKRAAGININLAAFVKQEQKVYTTFENEIKKIGNQFKAEVDSMMPKDFELQGEPFIVVKKAIYDHIVRGFNTVNLANKDTVEQFIEVLHASKTALKEHKLLDKTALNSIDTTVKLMEQALENIKLHEEAVALAESTVDEDMMDLVLFKLTGLGNKLIKFENNPKVWNSFEQFMYSIVHANELLVESKPLNAFNEAAHKQLDSITSMLDKDDLSADKVQNALVESHKSLTDNIIQLLAVDRQPIDKASYTEVRHQMQKQENEKEEIKNDPWAPASRL